MKTATIVVDCKNDLGEGPVWDHINGKLMWIDYDGGKVCSYHVNSQKYSAVSIANTVMMVIPTNRSNWIVAIDKNVAIYDPQKGKVLNEVTIEEDKPNNRLNDGKCDGIESQEEINEKYYSEMSEVTVQMIDNMRWGSMLEHPKKGQSMKYPKATQIDKGFKVAPRDISVVRFDYYVEPEEAVFGYTLAAGDRQTGAGAQIIYNQAKSKDLPWPDTVRNEFIIRLGVSFGVFTRDQFLTQISTQQKMTA